MRDTLWNENTRGSVKGDLLTADIKLDLATEILRGFRIAPPMQDDLIEIMNMLMNVGVWFRDIVNPTKFNVIIGFWHLLTAHVSHSGALAVFNSRPCFPKGLSH